MRCDDRLKNCNYKNSTHHPTTVVSCSLTEVATNTLLHSAGTSLHPSTEYEDESLAEVFTIQTEGLAKRLRHTGIEKATIGISGGLDSTLALLVTIATFDRLQLPRENIVGITMPGFGTTDRTYHNAIDLMHASCITVREIPI